MSAWTLRILDTHEDLEAVEELQRLVWPGSETEVVPVHMLIAVVHNGGLVIGAFNDEDPAELLGFVYGFPGLYFTPDGPRPMHCSHQLGVHPDYRNSGLGFALKRAQWQMVRHQGLDRVTWTYDPLLSRNAYLNIAKLGAVCNTYQRDVYGDLRDGLNRGLPTDRFVVDWWVNTKRVERRLSTKARPQLDLAHFLAAGAEIINPTKVGGDGWPKPVSAAIPAQLDRGEGMTHQDENALLLVEIPADFLALKVANPELALDWRLHSRPLFENLFGQGYLVTDFVHLPGTHPRSFYVLSHGESTF
ncbi:MAG TPA: GNAT family N-acetyltransferase [Anaerolineales bacterium]|nr:GNAT family N-acetyltransferase [Anaerolineales bacterium]